MIVKTAIVFMLSVLLIAPGVADTVELSARPAKCIALRKGQICYQTITLRWQAELPGDYCLRVDDEIVPIKCWTDSNQGVTRFEFASKKNARFHLNANTDDEGIAIPLISTDVVVAWVYKSRRAGRPRWRLF
ncbi:MAG: DUF3019 domain-containing protein [Granulosicoccus sp.]|nr:DUF3019 domain-containing protein [Granulosicoccus sp.]